MSGDGRIVSERETARGSLLNGVGSLISTGLGFVLVIVITRSFGADNAGVFFGVVALCAIVATATKLGTETALVFLVARYRSEGARTAIRESLVAAMVPVAAVSVVAAAVLFFGARNIGGLFSDDNADTFAEVLQAMAPFVPAWSIGLVLLGATRGAGSMVPTAVGLQIVQPIAQLALVTLAATRDWGLPLLAVAWSLPLVSTAAIAAIGLLPVLGGTEAEAVVARPTVWRDLWSYAGPRGLAGTLQVALDRVGILIVGALLSSAAAGQWSAITRLVGVAQHAFHAIGQALSPRLSSLAHRGDWKAAGRVFDQITLATVAVLAPPLLALVMFPKAALDVFGGPEFEDVAVPLAIAALATLAAVALAHVDTVLLMSGRSSTALLDTVAGLATTIVLNLVLVPLFGLNGAAIAMGVGVLVYRGSAAIQIARWFDVHALSRPVVTVLAIAGVGVGATMLLGRLVGGDRLPVAIVSSGAAVLAYAAFLYRRGPAMGVDFRPGTQ